MWFPRGSKLLAVIVLVDITSAQDGGPSDPGGCYECESDAGFCWSGTEHRFTGEELPGNGFVAPHRMNAARAGVRISGAR